MDAISDAQAILERGNVLLTASDAVVELMFRQSVSTHWGTGRSVSYDGMSLDASRHLWNARVGPRRRTYGMGQYQHVRSSANALSRSNKWRGAIETPMIYFKSERPYSMTNFVSVSITGIRQWQQTMRQQ